MQSFTYLLVNCCAVVICLVASFDRRIQFNRLFGTFALSATVVAVPFLLWDAWFTQKGVWWFDLRYTLGITLAGLPLEEWLFFWCIPFACVFTYYCINRFFDLSRADSANNILVFASTIVLTVLALLHCRQVYTLLATGSALITLLYLHFIARQEWIARASLVYLLLMPGFLAVNGVLTGTGIPSPIVNYRPGTFLGIRIGTIPIEDVVYGYSLFLLNIYCFKYFQRKTSV
ncbi:putative lycopene cyclase [Flavihumibacter petaseus NBRC 106054]|uniref:Putative lycopene cyclase n=2 Tax=Flavihumibacter TaxID=1004301 RepID=A0A0E9MZ08_9BACT|nr:putative lycopene cyclase [Flavihumibacter petaseus NBRC 106054]